MRCLVGFHRWIEHETKRTCLRCGSFQNAIVRRIDDCPHIVGWAQTNPDPKEHALHATLGAWITIAFVASVICGIALIGVGIGYLIWG